MTQEQDTRSSVGNMHRTLGDIIEVGQSLTPEEVHKKIGRKPHVTRIPVKHRLVEDYKWKGPFTAHTVYAYYTTAATKLFEDVSMNQILPDREETIR